MIFKQDTEKNELNLIFTETDEVGTVKLVEDFCDGMAWFFIMFAARVGCQSENAKVLKKVCMEQIEKTVDAVIDDGNLEKLQKVLEESIPEEYAELAQKMEEEGFDEDWIRGAIRLAQECGSVEGAIDFLKEELGELECEDDE